MSVKKWKPIVVSFVKLKGGVGATVIGVNFACWLAKIFKKNVLFLDFDFQQNATNFFKAFHNQNTVRKMFENDEINEMEEVFENLWCVSGSFTLDEMEVLLSTNDNRNMVLYSWFMNRKDFLKQFDYIIIDNHPSFSTVVKNSLMVSDVAVCPLIPSELSEMSKMDIEIRFEHFKKNFWDYQNDKSYVSAELLFIGNMLDRDKESKQFLVDNVDTVANFPKRVVFNRSLTRYQPLCDMAQYSHIRRDNEGVFELIDSEFEKLKAVIDEVRSKNG